MKNFFVIWGIAWKSIILEPKTFFSSILKETNRKDPIYFVIPIYLLISLSYTALFQIKLTRLSKFIAFGASEFCLMLIFGSVARIFFDVLILYISAGILNSIIRQFKGKGNFIETLNVIAFAHAPMVFYPISFYFFLLKNEYTVFVILSIVIIAWDIYLTYTGVRTRHEMTPKNALIAVLIPVTISFGLILFMYLIYSKPISL